MNHKHRKVLHALFAHPVSANVAPRDVISMFEEMGAEVEQRHGGRIAVRLKGHLAEFPHPQHSLPKDEVVRMRHFLGDAGVDPKRDYPL